MPRRSSAPNQRYEAIEILLLWEGRVSRARLLDVFDIHETLASRDIAAFRTSYPDVCEFHSSTKSYVATKWIRPTLTTGAFLEYQQLIGAAASLDSTSTGVPMESARIDATHIEYAYFASIHQAMRDGLAIEIEYRSMNTPAPHRRIIRPHSLIQAGARWHVRAYCALAEAFRDFNLGRISDVKQNSRTDLPSIESDHDWNLQVSIKLVPHRDLSADQKRMVREEYMRGTTAISFTVRVPMLRYLIQAHRAAIDPDIDPAPAHLLMVAAPEKIPEGALW